MSINNSNLPINFITNDLTNSTKSYNGFWYTEFGFILAHLLTMVGTLSVITLIVKSLKLLQLW